MKPSDKINSKLNGQSQQDDHIPLTVTHYPELSQAALKAKDCRLYDCWLILREVYKYQGHCQKEEAAILLSQQLNIKKQSAHNILNDGDGLFWHIAVKKGDTKPSVWLKSIEKVCKHYEIPRVNSSVAIDLRKRWSTQERRAGIYEGSIVGKFESMAILSTRAEITERTGVSKITQIRYEKKMGFDKKRSSNKSKEYRRKLSESMKKYWDSDSGGKRKGKQSERMKQLYKDPVFIQKLINGMTGSPNKPEAQITKSTPHYISYTGDASFWRTLPNGKHSNPDWIIEPIQQTRKVIFYHGNYWHQHELHNRGQDLIDQWKQIGYECLVVWEDEPEEIILDKIAGFDAAPQ